MENICLFGAADNDMVFFENSDVLMGKNSKIVSVVSRNSFQDKVKTVGFEDADAEMIASESDTVVVCRSTQCSDSYVASFIEELFDHDVKVINYHCFDNDMTKKLKNDARRISRDYVDLSRKDKVIQGMMGRVSVPVIYVMGLADGTDKLNTELALQKILTERGYKTALITSDSRGDMFGAEVFPFELFDYSRSFAEIAENFSDHFVRFEENNEPDVIIVGIPSDVFSPFCEKDLSLPAYLMNKVCPPDYIVLNVLSDTLENVTPELLDHYIAEDMNKTVDALYVTHYSNSKIKTRSRSYDRAVKAGISRENEHTKCGKLVVHYTDKNRFEHIADDIIRKLTIRRDEMIYVKHDMRASGFNIN